MPTALFANPGQIITIAVQTVDSDGQLADGYQAPTVDFIRMPSGSNASGFPQSMTALETGIWIFSFTIPSGTSGLGSYLVSCSWPHPDLEVFQNEIFIITVALPFGNNSITFA